jgi:ribose 5-phosphate isomerase A
MSASDPVEEAKKKAAYTVVDKYIKSGMALGIGSGSTVVYVVERLIQRVKEENLKVVTCVPTSFQSKQLIEQGGLPLGTIDQFPELDLAIDGADEVDAHLNCIKGGGACQLQEKIVAACAKTFIVVADYRKNSTVLGEQWKQGVPIEVLPLAYRPVAKKIEKLGGKPVLRMCKGGKAGPIVTDNGNFVIDADFGQIKDPRTLEQHLKQIPGIIETGLFINMAEIAFFGNADGSVVSREVPKH